MPVAALRINSCMLLPSTHRHAGGGGKGVAQVVYTKGRTALKLEGKCAARMEGVGARVLQT